MADTLSSNPHQRPAAGRLNPQYLSHEVKMLTTLPSPRPLWMKCFCQVDTKNCEVRLRASVAVKINYLPLTKLIITFVLKVVAIKAPKKNNGSLNF